MINRLTYLIIMFLFCSVGGATLRVTKLRVEHMTDPQTVDAEAPRFSWVNECTRDERGQYQTAYRIVVAKSEQDLKKKRYVWDSGKVSSPQSVLVSYAGPKLMPLVKYHWKVMTWDAKEKASRWSETGHWTMGLPHQQWQAKWIVAKDYSGRAPLLRKKFVLSGRVRSAHAVVCGLGYHEFYVNGKKVGDDCLVPNISNYTRRYDLDNHPIKIDNTFSAYRVLYLGHDVTPLLQEGENVVGAVLGNGFYAPDKGIASIYGRPCLRMELHITYADGRREVICTDRSWQTRPSAIMYNGLYQGELYDARQKTEGWCTVSAPTEGWDYAIEEKGPDGVMTAQTSPADRVVERLSPATFTQVGDKTYDVDFGKEVAGWIHLKGVSGRQGDTVRVDFVCESPQGIQRYVLRGDGKEDYAPRFSWFVFKRARISGISLERDNVQAEVVNTDVRRDAAFACSDTLLERIGEIWRRSQEDNMHGCTPSDCPHRERLPYTGDGQAAAEMVMLTYDAAAFYAKWIRDIRDSQNATTGYVPNSAPWEPGAGGGVAWGAAMCIIPWQHYVQYADTQVLQDNYTAMKEQLRYMYTWLTEGGIMKQQMRNHGTDELCYWLNLGDWCPPSALPRDELVHTFYCWLCTDYTARAAKVLGHEADAAAYGRKAQDIWQAFHRTFYDCEAKTYGPAGSNIYALRMGVPADRLQDIRATLRKEIVEENRGHLNTGFLATKYFFETLSDNGMHDVAFTAITRRDFPSYGWWIEQGATTTWEQWDGKNSRNHPMFGGGLTWLYRKLAGVEADEAAPGYRHFTVRPALPEGLDSVMYAKETPYGKVVAQYSRRGKGYEAKVTVPVGTTCTLFLPDGNGSITESGRPVTRTEGVTPKGWKDGYDMFLLEQGTYSFRAEGL